MNFDRMTRPQVHDAMLAADGERARIAYAGLEDLEVRLERQRINPWTIRWRDRRQAHLARNRRSPEYVEANARFHACSDELERRDGDTLMRDRNGLVIGIW